MVPRTLYLERIRPFYDSPLIKVIVGVRRCGKSVLLQQIASELGREAPASLIVFIDFDDYANRHLLDPEQLHEHIISQIDTPAKRPICSSTRFRMSPISNWSSTR